LLNTAYVILPVSAAILFIMGYVRKGRIMEALRLSQRAGMKAVRSAAVCLGLGLIFFSLLGPQIFAGYTEVSKVGMDIYILMDTSKSMLTADIKPDRLTVAKRTAEYIIDNLHGDRVGFIPFASDAYIQMPLTDDYHIAKMFLGVMDTEMIGGGGTNLATAIRLAEKSFQRTSSADKVILIISDGEEHDGASGSIIKNITDESVKVYTVGIGTERGGLVPVYNISGDRVDYMKDGSGNPVTSRLGADTLKRLARDGRGSYYQIDSQSSDISSLSRELSNLKKDRAVTEQIRRFKPLYRYFLAPGTAVFLAAWLLPERRRAA